MKKVKKAGATLTSLALCAALALTPGTMAFADIGGEVANSSDAGGEVYLPDNYQEPGIMPLERGQCTDVYSRAWCNAHGYRNNRPVGKMVKLNAKEKACYYKFLGKAVAKTITGAITKGPAGALMGPPSAAFSLFKCLF